MRKRDLYMLAGVILIAIGLGIGVFLTDTVETGAWGLSFRTQGQPPVGPANSAVLARYDAAYLGDTTRKVLYLTFDAGYENGNINAVMDGDLDDFITAFLKSKGNFIK